MAEVLFKNWLKQHDVPGEWEVLSAGTWVRDGFTLSPAILAALDGLGIDLSGRSCWSITAEALEKADLALCMTHFHREALQVEFPCHAGRIRMLSEMLGQRFDVRDVDLLSGEECLRVARELASLIDAAAPHIVEALQGRIDGH